MPNNKLIPMLFSSPMATANMAGTKTQTRRVLKPQPTFVEARRQSEGDFTQFTMAEPFCRYGKPGDIIWMRESYYPGYFGNGDHAYKADWNKTAAEYVSIPKWKPSIHMPLTACRYFALITNIRLERLHKITEADALAEGVSRYPKSPIYGFKDYLIIDQFKLTAKESYETLWRSINGYLSWHANPWVWVIEYKQLNATATANLKEQIQNCNGNYKNINLDLLRKTYQPITQ
jgi:hypothetical protein